MGNFNTFFSITNRIYRQKNNYMNIEYIIIPIKELDLNDISRSLYSTNAEQTFYSSACEVFIKIDHILDHKASLNTYKELRSYRLCSLTTVGVN